MEAQRLPRKLTAIRYANVAVCSRLADRSTQQYKDNVMIVIAVELIVDPGHASEFREQVPKYAKNSLSEPGCVRFDVAEDSEQAGRFVMWENYLDFEAVDAHRAEPYFDQFFESITSITKSRTLSLLELITPTEQDG